jgi:hypothetical protein
MKKQQKETVIFSCFYCVSAYAAALVYGSGGAKGNVTGNGATIRQHQDNRPPQKTIFLILFLSSSSSSFTPPKKTNKVDLLLFDFVWQS